MKKLSAVTIVAAAVVSMGVATLHSAAVRAKELKVATFMSPKHHLNQVVFTNLAKAVGKATNGEVTMKLYSGGQLGKGPVQQYKRVVDNVAEVSFGIQGYTSSIFPRTMVVAQPGVGTEAVEISKKLWSVYDQYLKAEYSRVKILGLWSNTPAVLFTRKKEVRSLDDVRGMKIRALDATNIPQMNAWGASGIFIPISGVYDALDKGVIDAVWVAVNALFRPWRFAEVSHHVVDGMIAPSALFWLAMNKQVWGGLSRDAKAKIDGLTGIPFSLETARTWAVPDHKAIARLKKGVKGVSYRTLGKAEAARFDTATMNSVEAFLAASEKKGVPARAIYKAVTTPSS